MNCKAGGLLRLILVLGALGAVGAVTKACRVTVPPGRSIQAAIDAAPPGAVICLEEGTWFENLVVTQPIVLSGRSGKSEIAGGRGDLPVVRIALPEGEDGEVVLWGLKVTGGISAGPGIYVGEHAGVTLDNVTVEGCELQGLWVGAHAQVTVRSSAIRDNSGGGIRAEGFAWLTVVDSVVSHNGGDGIAIAERAQASLSGSRVEGNRGYGVLLLGEGCGGEGGPFAGRVTGRKNLIPWPGLPDGNSRGSVCPDALGFLLTEAGGALDRRPEPGPTLLTGVRFVLEPVGLEGLPPLSRQRRLEELIAVLQERLQGFRFSQAEVRPREGNRIEVLVPGVADPARLRSLLSQRSILTFHKVLAASCCPGDLPTPGPGELLLPNRERMEWFLVEGEPLLTGEAIEQATARTSGDPRAPGYFIPLRFTPQGAAQFAAALQKLSPNDRLAIVVDGVVQSAPVVTSSILEAARRGGPAVRDSTTITGRFTLEEAQALAAALGAGALPVEVRIVEEGLY